MEITVLIKIAFIILCTFLVIFALYSLSIIHSKNVRIQEGLPQPYKAIYERATKIPFINLEVERYENSLGLINGSRQIGKLIASVYCGLIPAIVILLITLTFNYVTIWYYAICISFFGLTIPYLFITNRISKKARMLRTANLKYYQAAERYFSRGTQTSETFNQLKITSTGSLRKVYTNFSNKYFVKPSEAYDDFVITLNDKYAKSFMKAVIKYDESGENPCEDIHSLVRTGSTHYRLISATSSTMGGVRVLGLICCGGSIAFSLLCDNLATSVGTKPTCQFLTYLGLVLALTTILVSQIYEKNAED